MHRKLAAILAILFLFIISSAGAYTTEETGAIYDSLWNLTPDYQAGLAVNNLHFEIDNGEFDLFEGDLAFFNTIAGNRVGFIFTGKGKFTFKGPTPVETFSINKFTGDSVLTKEFKEMIILFSPDIFHKYFADLNTGPIDEIKRDEHKIKKFYDDLRDYSYDIPALIFNSMHNAGNQPVAWTNFDNFYFCFDPTETEPVTIFEDKRLYGIQTIVRCFPKTYYDSGQNMYDRDPVNWAIPIDYEINSTIQNNTDISCECRLILQSTRDSLYCVEFHHSSGLDMDSVMGTNDINLLTSDFDKDDASSTVVFFKRPLNVNEFDTIIFYYHSTDIIKKSEWGDFYLFAPSGWYPILGYSNYATCRLKFKTPEQLTFLAVGRQVVDSVSGDWKYTEWVSPEPLNQFSFNYGYFDSLEISEAGLPDVKVYRSNAGHVKRLFANDMLDLTAHDILATIDFCSNMFAPYPYPKIMATEIPMWHGQSFPGFLHLAWVSFEGDYDGKGFEMDAFRAHEVSHQWWGGLVGYKSYHDQWLSEGFAEYTGAWYMQVKDGDNKRFLQMLKDWQDFITQKGGGSGSDWSEGSDAGPIWLGYRLSSKKSDDYANLVYSKGAFVLHMLRMMLHDYTSNNDETFIRMLKDYVAQYRGRDVSTFDFKSIVEKYFQMDMSWFFNEWIFGTEIPTYKPRYEVSEENGKYILKVHTTVENVSEDFQMIVPLVVEFDNNSHTILKFWVKGTDSTFTSAPLPYKPKKFHFNPYEAVLCHVKD